MMPRFPEVYATRGAYLGSLKWYGAWRQFCFFPAEGTIFNTGCLGTIRRNARILTDIQLGRAA